MLLTHKTSLLRGAVSFLFSVEFRAIPETPNTWNLLLDRLVYYYTFCHLKLPSRANVKMYVVGFPGSVLDTELHYNLSLES